jgi:hypothetical protein
VADGVEAAGWVVMGMTVVVPAGVAAELGVVLVATVEASWTFGEVLPEVTGAGEVPPVAATAAAVGAAEDGVDGLGVMVGVDGGVVGGAEGPPDPTAGAGGLPPCFGGRAVWVPGDRVETVARVPLMATSPAAAATLTRRETRERSDRWEPPSFAMTVLAPTAARSRSTPRWR